MAAEHPVLLIIDELGSIGDISAQAQTIGFQTTFASTQRKALKLLKTRCPAVILAEFIFTPDFRDRICNLDTLSSQLPLSAPDARLIIQHEPEDIASVERFAANQALFARLSHPIAPQQLDAALHAAFASLGKQFP